jgi:hypothetical protein
LSSVCHMSCDLLFQKTYDLVKWLYPTVNSFPRKQRLILSQRIEVTAIRILELSIDFNESRTETNRKKILHEAQKLQILLRVCKDLSYLSFKRYEYASSLLNEISDAIASSESGGGVAKRPAQICTVKSAHSGIWNWRTGRQEKARGTRKRFRTLSSTWRKTFCKSSASLKLSLMSHIP